MGKNTNKKWKDKAGGVYSDKKQARLDKKKGKKMARLKKRAARGNILASNKLERIRTREALDEALENPMVSDAEVMQNLASQTANLGTIAGQGALANVLTGPEGPSEEAIKGQVGAMAEPVAAGIAHSTDTLNKLQMMKIQDLQNRIERQRDRKAQENVAGAQLALQGAATGLGAGAGFMNPPTQGS